MPRPPSLTISALKRMLNQRRQEMSKLLKKRVELQKDLASVDRQIQRLDGDGTVRRGGGGSRARNDKSLAEVLADVLMKSGEAMGVGDIVSAVEATGYRSSSANFRGIVNQTLIKERKRFTSPSRGMYQMKK